MVVGPTVLAVVPSVGSDNPVVDPELLAAPVDPASIGGAARAIAQLKAALVTGESRPPDA